MRYKFFKYNCKHIEPLLWQHAGGQLKPEQKARVDTHVERCAVCQMQLQTIARIGQGLESLRQASVPATQTNWADVQARLAVTPMLPQSALPMRKAVPYRVLMGAGMAAAMALLWGALVPRGSEQERMAAKTAQNRPAKQNTPALTLTANSATNLSAGQERAAFEKSFSHQNNSDGSPSLTRPFALPTRFVKVAIVADRKLIRGKSVAWHGVKSVRRHQFARSHGLLARNATARPQRNASAIGVSAPILASTINNLLRVETTNYVLTGVEAESEPRPRAYVMDCVSTDAKSRNNEASNRDGEERAW